MPILLLLLLVGGALALSSSSSKGSGTAAVSRTSLVRSAIPRPLGLDAGLTNDQANAVQIALTHETRADRLYAFARATPPQFTLTVTALTNAANALAGPGQAALFASQQAAMAGL